VCSGSKGADDMQGGTKTHHGQINRAVTGNRVRRGMGEGINQQQMGVRVRVNFERRYLSSGSVPISARAPMGQMAGG
jgi:hypothetical protein